MKWDTFFNKKNKMRHQRKDKFDERIEIIEQFAPKKYRDEREAFFYNYKRMAPYPGPLFNLLQSISQRERLKVDQAAFVRELFLKLKAFYDPKEKLSLVEAVQDRSLIRKFRELFLFFYDKQDLSEKEIEKWLREL